VLVRRVDVSKREEMRAFAEAAHARVPALDLLVNNAGVGIGGGFLDTSLEDWDWIVGINLIGVVQGCHFFVPPMVKRGRGGHVVNISSAAGYLASSALAAYCTTKFGVLGLSEALREELHRHGIGVTAICPGIINTNITRTSPLRGAANTPGSRERMVSAYQLRGTTAPSGWRRASCAPCSATERWPRSRRRPGGCTRSSACPRRSRIGSRARWPGGSSSRRPHSARRPRALRRSPRDA
jgi:NAD(P)-dependent dehydrogenase (short-subunit alcohol dehydrogenase family)